MAAPITSSSPDFAGYYAANAVAGFEQIFSDYLRYNKREQGPLIEDRGHKVRLALFREFSKISPSAADIRTEASRLGWRIRRREGADGETLTPDQEIRARIRSRRFLSASFILREWRRPAEGRGQTGRFAARSRRSKEIGSAMVRTAIGEADPRVALTSLLEGAVAQSRRRGIASTVLVDQAQDMAVYVARKHQQWLAARTKGETRAVITV